MAKRGRKKRDRKVQQGESRQAPQLVARRRPATMQAGTA
jgi:hypothetical protein